MPNPASTTSNRLQEISGATAEVKKRTRFRWLVLLLCAFIYLIAGADRANIGVVAPYMAKDLGISKAEIGALEVFFIGYALIQIPAGLLYQKLGIRWLFGLAVLATSCATLYTGLASTALHLKMSRAALGVAEGPINVGILSMINRWFPTRERGTATGIFMASIKTAPALVPPLCAVVLYYFGWREVFILFAVPGIVLALVWLFFMRDNPRDSRFCSSTECAYIEEGNIASDHSHQNIKRSVEAMPRLDRIIRTCTHEPITTTSGVLRSWDMWGCCLGYFFMAGITNALMIWIPTYLVDVKHYQLFSMSSVASTPWVGAILGNIIGGVVSDRFLGGRRKPMMLLSTAATILTMGALIYSPSNPLLLACMFVAVGILLNLGYSTFLVYPMALVEKARVPVTVSIINTGGSLGGAFATFVVGLLLEHGNWDSVFMFFAGGAFFAFLVLLTMKEPMNATSAANID